VKSIEAAIALMKPVEWFTRVGATEPISLGMETEPVSSWQEALLLRGQAASADVFTEGVNMLTRELSARFRSEDRKWNKIAGEVRAALESEVLPRVDAIIDGNRGMSLGMLKPTLAS
jgi:hypothetical protein